MKGLIYKDITIFFKGIDKKMLLVAAVAIILLMANTGAYAGLFASVMLAMTVGMQNIMSFAIDEKVSWKKYELALPVKSASVVASKYVSVICTLAVSLVGSVIFNLLSSIAFQSFDMAIWGVSAIVAVIVPLLWTGIFLPFTYWFGFRSGQLMRIIVVFPIFYFVKYFEDKAGFSAMANSMISGVVVAGTAVILLFAISMMISVIGYNRRGNKG